MIVTRLKIANLRALESAEFRFQPGFNLIVGVNGVGKSTVLDALGVCLSTVVKQVNKLRTSVEAFGLDDIRVGTEALTVEYDIRCGETDYTYLVHKPRETSAIQEKKEGMPREQVHETPERNEFIGKALHGDKTGKQILVDPCKWTDANGSLTTLRAALIAAVLTDKIYMGGDP